MENTSGFDFSRIMEDAKTVITTPVHFYRNMPKTGGYAEPVVFVISIAVIATIIFILSALLGGGHVAAAGLSAIIIMPIMMLIGSFFSAAIMFVIWKLMGSHHGYETAYRSVAWSMAVLPVTAVLSLIPFFGAVIPVLWGCYLMWVASTEVHGLNKQTSMIVFGVLAIIGIIFNLGAERSAREMQSRMEQFKQETGKSLENLKNMSPEKAGEALGEFMKGMNKATGEN